MRSMITASDARCQMETQAFWDRARMWCLLKGMPWVQLNGSRACGVLYLRHLRRNTPGDEERDSLRALGLLYDHVGQHRLDDLIGLEAYGRKNYALALLVHSDDGGDVLSRIAAAETIPADIADRVTDLQRRVRTHLAKRDMDHDLFASLAWVKSPACWNELVA